MSGLRQRIWTLDIEALDAVDNPVTLRFASGDYTRRDPGPVDHYYEPRLKQPALFQVAASTGPLLNSNNRSGYGEAELINTDGGLDHLADYAVDGRLLTLRLVDDDTAVDVLVATVASLAFGERSVTVRLRDPQSLLQLPLGLSRYAGDNVLPDGVEGTQDDIAGTTKPRIYGSVENCTPVLVNTSKLIYQVHDSADVTVTAVRDRGVPLTPAGEALDLADLLASSPAAGEWRWFEGYIALGATPAGTLTCDATRASAGAGQVFSELAAPHVVPAGDVSALDAVGAVGLYVRGDSTPAELLDRLAAGVGAYWAFNAAGEIRVVLLQAPDVAPVQSRQAGGRLKRAMFASQTARWPRATRSPQNCKSTARCGAWRQLALWPRRWPGCWVCDVIRSPSTWRWPRKHRW